LLKFCLSPTHPSAQQLNPESLWAFVLENVDTNTSTSCTSWLS